MAWTSTDLATIEKAIKNGLAEVQFSDGRRMRYQTVGDLMRARDAIKDSLAAAAGNATRCTYASFNKD